MKLKKLKLQLNKETIAKLDNFQLENVRGGIDEVHANADYVFEDGEAGVNDADQLAFTSLFHCSKTPKCVCRTITKPKKWGDEA